MTNTQIPFLNLAKYNRSFEPELTAAVSRVIDSGIYIRGKEVEKFEERFALYTGSRHCVGVGNGFDAIRLIFRGWIISGLLRAGDEVLVPANTYIASILGVTENGLRPVFIEPDLRTMTIDAERIEASITKRTRALLVVHLYGRNALTPEIMDLSERHGFMVVEDNAQAAGCMAMGKRTGSVGHAAAHSFFPSKNLGALGDGGAVTTDDRSLADMVRTLGHYGSARKGHNLVQGVNSRLDEVQAAALNVKLGRLDVDNDIRRTVADRYRQSIDNPFVQLPEAPHSRGEHVWHVFVVRSTRRDELQDYLSDEGIETLVHYPVPPHRQPAFKEMNGMSFPLTDHLHSEVLSLPLHPVLEQHEVSRIIEVTSAFRPVEG